MDAETGVHVYKNIHTYVLGVDAHIDGNFVVDVDVHVDIGVDVDMLRSMSITM